jgi:hypothetical protein
MSESKITKVGNQSATITQQGNQSALISDTSEQDFYFRDFIYLGDEILANIIDHEGAFIVLEEDVRATIGGSAGVTNTDGNVNSTIN